MKGGPFHASPNLPVFERARRSVAEVFADPSGAVAVILALAIFAIVGFAGLASEVAGWYYTTRAMQGATDAAATSAAAELAAATSAGSTASGTQLTNTGRSVAAALHFTNGVSSTTVTVNHPPAATANLNACSLPFAAFDCYIEVVITQPQTPLLSALFMSSGPTIATRAVALANVKAADQGCVLALDHNSDVGLTTSGNPSLNFSNCALYVNSKLDPGAVTMNGNASINAAAAYVVGGISGGGLTTTDGIYTGTNPTNDPYAGVAMPSYSGCNQNSYKLTGNKTDSVSASGTTPYVFCNGLAIMGGSTLTLGPGIYVIDQGTLDLKGGATLNATGGVTIILTNHTGGSPADVNIAGNAAVNLVAPTTGSTAGIALFQDRVSCSSCSDAIAGGSSLNITGAIYFPNNAVTFTGGSATGAQCTQLIAYTITFKGNSAFNSTCGSAGTKTISATNGTLVM